MIFDELFTNSPEDIMLDNEAEELEDAQDDVIGDEGTDIDMTAKITDDDVIAAELDDNEDDDEDEDDDFEYDEEEDDEDDDEDFVDYEVDESDDKEELEDYIVKEEDL